MTGQPVSPLLLALAAAYLAVWAFNMYAARAFSLLGRMIRLAEKDEPHVPACNATPVTLVITHDGQGAALRRLLPAFLEQSHPDFEILLISSRPLDREAEAYLSLLTPCRPALHSHVLPAHAQGVSAEALTLSLALRTAEHPWVVICRLESRPAGTQWLGRMASQVRPGICFVAGLTLRRPTSFLYLWRQMMNLPYALRHGLHTLQQDNLMVHAPGFLAAGGMSRAAELNRGILAEAVNRLSRPANTRLCLHPEAFVWQPSPATPQEWLARELFRHHVTLRFTRRHRHVSLQGTIVAATWLHSLLLVALIATAVWQGAWWMVLPAPVLIGALVFRRAAQMNLTTEALSLPPCRLTLGYRLHRLAITRLRILLAYDISDKNEYRKQNL